MIMLSMFILFMAIICGAVLYRARGTAGEINLPRPLEQMGFCAVFLFTLGIGGVHALAVGIGYVVSVVATLTGHGLYFPSRKIEATEPERLDVIVSWLFGVDPRTADEYNPDWRGWNGWYFSNPMKANTWDTTIKPKLEKQMNDYGMTKLYWRCMCGMAVTGGAVTLAPGMALMIWHPLHGAIVALSGFISKPLGYAIGQYTPMRTDASEYIYGGIQWFIVAATAITLIGTV